MWILLVMVGLLLLGVPMMVPLSVGTFFLLFSDFPFLKPELVIQQMIGGLQPVVLTAVPMFILAADIMLKGSTAQRLLDLVEALRRPLARRPAGDHRAGLHSVRRGVRLHPGHGGGDGAPAAPAAAGSRLQ